ncbi:uncharacterized protein LOC142350579 isoform X2 [Convolutriloba macropyga]|uniref:uncharacterized protein LOC142350579 isoform X2 n=1 Tax=Convolutriloba macropyga TaxID=536237 RepID=UPI003F51CA39
MCCDHHHHHHHHCCDCDCDWIFFMCCWSAVFFYLGLTFLWYMVIVLSPLPIWCSFYIFFMLTMVPSCISSVFGMMGYYYYTRRLLLFHLGFGLSALLIGILGIILVFVLFDPIDTARENFWRFTVWHNAVNNQYYDWYDELHNPFHEFTRDIPLFQIRNHCCGFYGGQDFIKNWTAIYGNQKAGNQRVPPLSCCPLFSPKNQHFYDRIKEILYPRITGSGTTPPSGDHEWIYAIDPNELLQRYDACYLNKPIVYYPTACGDIIRYIYNYWIWIFFYVPFFIYLFWELVRLLVGICLLPNRYDLYPPPFYSGPNAYNPIGNQAPYQPSGGNCYCPTNPLYSNGGNMGAVKTPTGPHPPPATSSV